MELAAKNSQFHQPYSGNIMKKLAILSVLAVAATASAHAQTYVELSYVHTKLQERVDDSRESANPASVRAIVGYEFHPNFAVEGMLATGIKSDRINFSDGDSSVLKNKTSFGLFLRPQMHLNDNLQAFARLGVVRSSFTAEDDIDRIDLRGTRAAYGLGVSYRLTQSVSLTADYMQYYKRDDITSRGFSIGVAYRF
jgi:opacity protein-like surface antigen